MLLNHCNYYSKLRKENDDDDGGGGIVTDHLLHVRFHLPHPHPVFRTLPVSGIY
jgi:hypothetical protein